MKLLWAKRVAGGGTPVTQIVTDALEAYLGVTLAAVDVDGDWRPRSSVRRKAPAAETPVLRVPRPRVPEAQA